jgi:hypothetical protein
MGRRRRSKAKKQPAIGQRLRDWLGKRTWKLELGPAQRQLIGLGLFLLAIVTFLGLLGISTGSILGWWVGIVSQAFGWVAFPVTLGLAVVGLRLLWPAFYERLPLRPGCCWLCWWPVMRRL